MKCRSGRAPPLCAPRIQARTRSFSPTKPLRFSVEQYEQGGSVSDWKSPGRAMSFRWVEASSATARKAAGRTHESASTRKSLFPFISLEYCIGAACVAKSKLSYSPDGRIEHSLMLVPPFRSVNKTRTLTCRIAFFVRLADSIGGFAGTMELRTGARPSRSLQSASRRPAWVRGRRHQMVRSCSREGFRRDARAREYQLHRSGLGNGTN